MNFLTGRRRYRAGWYVSDAVAAQKTLVLQVEVQEFNTVQEGKPGRWVCMWRDATVADVAAGEIYAG